MRNTKRLNNRINLQLLTKWGGGILSSFVRKIIPLRSCISLFLSSFSRVSLQSKSKGYILILVSIFIPVVIFGVQYIEKVFVRDHFLRQKPRDLKVVKRCAREAALAVAKNWNPGLTFGQQRAAVYKVADAVYNAHPCYYNSVFGRAIPGIIRQDDDGGVVSLDAGQRFIEYITLTKHMNMYYMEKWNKGGSYGHYMMWLGIDKATDPKNRISIFDEVKQDGGNFSLEHQEIFIEPHILSVNVNGTIDDKYTSTTAVPYYTPTVDDSSIGDYTLKQFLLPDYTSADFTDRLAAQGEENFSNDGAVDLEDEKYTVRTTGPEADYVEISLEGDKIKVRTDEQTAYAVPAKCNVDIVLAIPTNAATCNVNNRDTSSDEPESGYTDLRQWEMTEEVQDTPIYEMGQACKEFVKDNFYHVRGVNMALIPYSGKLSISPDRAAAWTIPFPPFDSSSFNTSLMIGACLYATSGAKDASLTQAYKTTASDSDDVLPTDNTPYYWGSVLTGCPIMCRRGSINQSSDYGGNCYICGGFLFGKNDTELDISKDNSSKAVPYKYMRMNLNPCYVGYANQLSMRCERACTTYYPNPYYMIEPTADMVKIYEMCNALYPIYDPHNVSNFVFAALEWANNMFQTWTKNPQANAVNGSDDSAVLSRESKRKSGRKKAVILLVNKPDWFEPYEMTYLGFNNDFSEVPTTLSDKIDFSIDYSDTSKKFLDGSYYDGSYYGANKILKCTVSGGTYTLTFPHSGLLIVKVKPTSSSGTFQFISGSSNTTSYTVVDEKIFILQPSQITSTTVMFTVSGLTVVSAEITNRPYTAAQIITPKSVSYNDPEFINSSQTGSTLSWTTRTQTDAKTNTINASNVSGGGNSSNGKLTYYKYQTQQPAENKTENLTVTHTTENKKILIEPYIELKKTSSSSTERIYLDNYDRICYIINRDYDYDYYYSIVKRYGDGLYYRIDRFLYYDERKCGIVAGRLAPKLTNFYIGALVGAYSDYVFPTSVYYFFNLENKVDSIEYLNYGVGNYFSVNLGDQTRFSLTVREGMGGHYSDHIEDFYISVYRISGVVKNVPISATISKPPQSATVSFTVAPWGLYITGQGTCTYNGTTQTFTSQQTYSFTTANATTVTLDNASISSATCSYMVPGKNYESGGKLVYFNNYTSGIDTYTKTSVSITTSGSGTLKFTSGVTGTTSYSGAQTITIDASRLSGDNLVYTLTEGLKVTSVSLKYNLSYPVNIIKSTGNNAVVYTTLTGSTISAEKTVAVGGWTGSYYKDLGTKQDSTGKYAARVGPTKTEVVYDVIDFTNSDAKGKNGVLTYTVTGNGKSNGLYYISNGTLRITSSHRGDLELTVAPVLTAANGSITLKYGSNTAARTISAKTTITIPAGDMQVSGTAPSASYYMDFDATNLVIMRAKFVKWQPIFTKLPVPQRSSVIDFSKIVTSKPQYDSTFATYGKDLVGGVPATTTYDYSLGYWVSTGGYNDCHDMLPYSKNDSYYLVRNLDETSVLNKIYWSSGADDSLTGYEFYTPGLTLMFYDSEQNYPRTAFDANNKHALICAGYTKPVNAVLYNYAGGITESLLNTFNSATKDFNQSVMKQLTSDACKKLKDEGVRIYVVKYRKQDKFSYRERNDRESYVTITGSHNYSEIDDCASSGKVYDISNEADLKAKLDAIAADIKNWAGYEEAEFIESHG